MTTWHVETDLFKGPLDLLLYLVRRDELDVCDLPVAWIVRQFQDFIAVLEFIDLELAGDFIVMATTLAEIKSRLVLPAASDEVEESIEPIEGDDARHDLIHQLLEYRKFREAATALEEHAAEWQERYPRLTSERPQASQGPASDLIKEVELWDLVSALARVLEKKQIEEQSRIRNDDTPISVYVEQIGSLTREQGRVAFTSLFDDANERSRIVGIFLAILELLRHHSFRAEQDSDFEEIWIMPPETDSSTTELPAAGEPAPDDSAAVEE